MGTISRTLDTTARISEPNLPADDRSGDGYDYMDQAEKAGWITIANWGEEGYDFGQWPYIIGFARAVGNGEGRRFGFARAVGNGEGRRFGFGLYVEGDTTTDYYDTAAECREAISRQAFWFWKHDQSDGPADLPEHFEDLPATYRQPCKY